VTEPFMVGRRSIAKGTEGDACALLSRWVSVCGDGDFCDQGYYRKGMILDLQGLVGNGPGLSWRK
jgi:hypothetical protein